MHILITGSSSSIGLNLLSLLSSEELIGVAKDPITEITLADIDYTRVALPITSFVVGKRKIDIAGDDGPSCVEELFYGRPEFIFHLSDLSNEADYDFDRGHRVNVKGTKNMLDAIKTIPDYCPRFVLASSITTSNQRCEEPQGTYDTQKALAELLVSEYSRNGFVDGISVRLPTVIDPSGTTHKTTATSFFPSIIREPLSGHEALCPVPLSFRHTITSPKAAAGNLLQAANLSPELIDVSRTLDMPGIAPSVYELMEAMENIAGESVTKLVRQEKDISIWKTVSSWPQYIDDTHALSLGFVPDASIEEIVRSCMEDGSRQKKCSIPPTVGKKHEQMKYSLPPRFERRQLSGVAA